MCPVVSSRRRHNSRTLPLVPEIVFYTRISDFFKANFPNIKIASDIERDLAIEELGDSGSFISTHLAIGRLSKHSDFTPLQIEELVRIAQSNNQVGGSLATLPRVLQEFVQA
jgi:hypothetical protein